VSPSSSSPSGGPSSPGGPSGKPDFTPTPPPTGKPAPPSSVTVRGEVKAGVEAGCLMITSGGQQYQLVGGDRALLRPGRSVEVVGVVQSDLITICQQGTPLVVRQAKSI
jgi:hypothetical protein